MSQLSQRTCASRPTVVHDVLNGTMFLTTGILLHASAAQQLHMHLSAPPNTHRIRCLLWCGAAERSSSGCQHLCHRLAAAEGQLLQRGGASQSSVNCCYLPNTSSKRRVSHAVQAQLACRIVRAPILMTELLSHCVVQETSVELHTACTCST